MKIQNPSKGRTYLDRAIELYQNSGMGKFSISHYQVAEDNANEENEPTDFEEACIGNTDCYEKPDWMTLFSRPELQPCPGTVGEWTSWSNCDRSCNEGVKIRPVFKLKINFQNIKHFPIDFVILCLKNHDIRSLELKLGIWYENFLKNSKMF